MKNKIKVYKAPQLTIKEEFTDYAERQTKYCENPFRNGKNINLCVSNSDTIELRGQGSFSPKE